MKVLAIGAHPDDIEIFMLGFLLACKKRGDKIYAAIATDGNKGNVKINHNLKNIRAKETVNALKDIAVPHFFNFPDGQLHQVAEASSVIKNYILSIEPHLVITHPPEDYHPDHRALSNYVSQATGFNCPILFSDTLLGVSFEPNYYVDITPYFQIKCRAILKHKSQLPKKFLEAIKLQNQFRSAQCNAPIGTYAEAYRYEKRFPFSDIRSLLPPSPGINSFYKSLNDSLI